MVTPVKFQSLAAAAVLPGKPIHLAIGMFDGLHLGHQTVIGSAVHSAKRRHGTAAVLSFFPHPSTLFRPENPTRLLMRPEIKMEMLGRLDVEVFIEQPFDAPFAAIPAGEFVRHIRQYLPSLESIYVGENWRFGKGRVGNVALLIEQANELGLSVVSAERVKHNGEAISSTRIRAHLEKGEMDAVNELLGYAYFSMGSVVPGKRLGRTIGFPTLNLQWKPDLAPRFGVYAVQVKRKGEIEFLPAVANYGLRPTTEEAREPLLEVHVMNSCGLTTGDFLEVEWLAFLRPEEKFSGVDALRQQIAIDRDHARDLFQRREV